MTRHYGNIQFWGPRLTPPSLSHLSARSPECTCPPPWAAWCCALWPGWWGHSWTPSWSCAGLADSHWEPVWSTVCVRSGRSLEQEQQGNKDIRVIQEGLYSPLEVGGKLHCQAGWASSEPCGYGVENQQTWRYQQGVLLKFQLHAASRDWLPERQNSLKD